MLVARAEIEAATTAARDAVIRAAAAGGDPRALHPSPPPPVAQCRLLIGVSCALQGRAVVGFTLASASATPCPNGGCSVYEQENDRVGEGRVEATIEAQTLASGGDVLAERSAHVTFRTMAVAPYATLAGQSDVSAPSGIAPGDDAGAAPVGAAPGTLVDVLYRNARSGADMPANVWQAHAQTAPHRSAWAP